MASLIEPAFPDDDEIVNGNNNEIVRYLKADVMLQTMRGEVALRAGSVLRFAKLPQKDKDFVIDVFAPPEEGCERLPFVERIEVGQRAYGGMRENGSRGTDKRTYRLIREGGGNEKVTALQHNLLSYNLGPARRAEIRSGVGSYDTDPVRHSDNPARLVRVKIRNIG